MALWLHLTLSCDNCGKEEDIVVNFRDDGGYEAVLAEAVANQCEHPWKSHDNKDFCGADCLEIYRKVGSV